MALPLARAIVTAPSRPGAVARFFSLRFVCFLAGAVVAELVTILVRLHR